MFQFHPSNSIHHPIAMFEAFGINTAFQVVSHEEVTWIEIREMQNPIHDNSWHSEIFESNASVTEVFLKDFLSKTKVLVRCSRAPSYINHKFFDASASALNVAIYDCKISIYRNTLIFSIVKRGPNYQFTAQFSPKCNVWRLQRFCKTQKRVSSILYP